MSTSVHQPSRALWLGLALTVVLCGLPLFVNLGGAETENDEAIYSFGVETMLENGDWLTPRVIPDKTLPFFEKPPLKFWIVAAPIRLGLLPADEFGLRFWDAVFGAASMVYVFLIGRRLGGPLAGVAAAILLFAHRALLFEHGFRSNNMESALVLAYCGGMWHFLVWRDALPSPRARHHAVAASLYFVLGFMTKFVAAVFLPLVWAIALLSTRDGRARLRAGWWTWTIAGGLALALILPWFVYQYARAGREFIDSILMGHVVARFTVGLDPTHIQPWHFYFSALWQTLREAGTLVVTLAGLALLTFNVATRRLPDGGLILLWFGAPLALISFGSSKIYHYAYPFLPPLAVAGGLAIAAIPGIARRAFEWIFGRVRAADPLAILQPGLIALIVTSALPVAAYAMNLARLGASEHPVRSARECVRRVIDGSGGQIPARGFWVEGHVGWVYYYNFRDLGPWQQRDVPSDAAVVLNLFVPASWRPVVITTSRFQEVMDRLRAADPALLELVARRASLSVPEIQSAVAQADVGMMTFAHERVLLPGPYRVCATDRLRVDGPSR